MDFNKFDIDFKNELIDLLENKVIKIFNADGDIEDTTSEKFKLLSLLYKDCYNLLAKDILIKKLKINEQEAKLIHFSSWEKLDFINYNSNQQNFITSYLSLINDFAADYIKTKAGLSDNTAIIQLVFSRQDSDIDDAVIKKRWAFIWKFISNIDELTKKIFMYKLYAGLTFEDISKILKKDEKEIKLIYIEKESELFESYDFKKFFNIR